MAKILLVEDNEMNRDMLSRRLHRKGYTVLFAEDGAEGVAKARSDNPDLILMDLDLPVMDGWEATRQLKRLEQTCRIPVIALTAHAMAGDREKALAAGCDDYDTKPVELKRLLPKIEALLLATGQKIPVATPAYPHAAKFSNSQAAGLEPVAGILASSLAPGVPPHLQSSLNRQTSNQASVQVRSISAPLSLLVVDDSSTNRSLLAHHLTQQGYEITTASRGQEALELIQTQTFNLVLLDVMMPGVSGLDVLAELRRQYSSSQLPIVMVTASDQSEDVVKALELGANDYITKPINFPVAQARIKSLLTMVESFWQQSRLEMDKVAPIQDPSLLSGRYKLIESLGSGGFGRTFLARDTQRPRAPVVVVKQLKPLQTSPRSMELARRLFKKEAETLERLKHEQIPQLLAYFEENQEFYLVQDYIEGTVLEDELQHHSFAETQVLGLIWSLVTVLEYIHRQNVIHRDIKPQNIIRCRSSKKYVLIDFGSVKELSLEIAEGPKKTVGIGSRGFAPPEQYAGRPRFSSDIYAVGMVAIQALTGFYPDQLTESTATGGLMWQLPNVQVHQSVATIIDTMIRADFRERYQSATEVLRDLRRILEDFRQSRRRLGS